MNYNILVVDDEELILEGIGEYLKEAGYVVLRAMDGIEAMELFDKYSIHLIVLDLLLPKKDGFEVLREIRSKSAVPIIILSALEDEPIQLKGFDLKADDYVVKPVSLALLQKRVEVLLERHYREHDIWKYKDSEIFLEQCKQSCYERYYIRCCVER
ncbi:response regulator transcription factor [Gemella cuniculi]